MARECAICHSFYTGAVCENCFGTDADVRNTARLEKVEKKQAARRERIATKRRRSHNGLETR